jgi:hypothetical protein
MLDGLLKCWLVNPRGVPPLELGEGRIVHSMSEEDRGKVDI